MLTARAERPRSLNNLEKDCVNVILGLSSATTMHVRTQDRLTPFIWEVGWRKQPFKFEVNNSRTKPFQFTEQMEFQNTGITDLNWLYTIHTAHTQFGSIDPWQPSKTVPRRFVAGFFSAQDTNYLHRIAATQPFIILGWKPHKVSLFHRAGLTRDLLAPVQMQAEYLRH